MIARAPSMRLRSAGLAAMFVVAACCNSPTPYKADVDAVDIVHQNSSDAFKTFFDPAADGDAFRAFDVKVVAAHDRAGLDVAWNASPPLAAKGADFLDQHVFAPAVQERKWPKDARAETLEPAFVEGVHLGVRDFLEKR